MTPARDKEPIFEIRGAPEKVAEAEKKVEAAANEAEDLRAQIATAKGQDKAPGSWQRPGPGML